MSSFSLDDIRAAAEAKYGATHFDLGDGKSCSLVNPLRLTKEKRKQLLAAQDRLGAETAEGEEAEDQYDVLADLILLIAKSEGEGRALLDAVGGDLPTLAEIFTTYSKSTQAGEA